MKKYAVILAAVFVAVSALSAFAAAEDPIGACIYKYDDTFMTNVRRAMLAEAERAGQDLDVVDSQNRQPLQNDQVDTHISKGVKALIINPVDRTAAEPIMQKAKAMVPLLVPLFVSAFRRATDLAMAMEARCYHGGEGRTKMKPLKYSAADRIAYLILFLFFAAIVAIRILVK